MTDTTAPSPPAFTRLQAIRHRAGRFMMWFLWAHVPLAAALALGPGGGGWGAPAQVGRQGRAAR
ncbi:MAG: hypothetical protein JJU40_04805, partial [Rhodobacteraceae bacterium]|nr:hypothetical protein [Paracoccaceae bacterium]